MSSIVERLNTVADKKRMAGEVYPLEAEAVTYIEHQAERIKELERDNAQAKEAIATLNAGKPLGEIVGLHTAQNALVRIKELEAARDEWVKIAAEKEDQLVRLRQRIDDAPVVAWVEHHKAGDNLNWEQVDHEYAKATSLISKEDLK